MLSFSTRQQIQNPKSKIQNPNGCVAQREEAIGLNPIHVKGANLFTRLFWGRRQIGWSRQPFKLEIAGSSPVVLAIFKSEHSQADKGDGLQNRQSSVQIRLLAPIFLRANAENDYIGQSVWRKNSKPRRFNPGNLRKRF